jgi:hypothetical protein
LLQIANKNGIKIKKNYQNKENKLNIVNLTITPTFLLVSVTNRMQRCNIGGAESNFLPGQIPAT